jgi:hypothetical protein
MCITSFLYGVAVTLLIETVVLKIVAAWMEKEIRRDREKQ